MDLDKAITITTLTIQEGRCYIIIGWQNKSFEMYIYANEQLWKGRLSCNRLAGFSRTLGMTEAEYFDRARYCLSQEKDKYFYEIKSGFFYWKREVNGQFVIEGFLPVDRINNATNQPDLVEILLILNKHLKDKIDTLQKQFETTKCDYERCLSDTEEFLNLKVDMEKALCDKFLHLLDIRKSKVEEEAEQDDGQRLSLSLMHIDEDNLKEQVLLTNNVKQ